MNRSSFVLIIIALFFTFSFAQTGRNKISEECEKNLVRIEGYAILEIPADFASFNFTVKGTGKDLNTAVTIAKDKIKKITLGLFDIGLKNKNLNTSRFFSGENYKGRAFFSSNKDYVTSIKVTVNLDSLELLEPSIIWVSENDIEKLSNISFQLKNFEKEKMETFEKALSIVEQKATAIQEKLDIKEMRVVYVEDMKMFDSRRINTAFEMRAKSNASISFIPYENIPLFYAETIKLESRIKVHYEILF